MVSDQLARRGISDRCVLEAMARVPRERFVGAGQRDRAYEDRALGIGDGQTISQPWIVAAMAQALELRGSERVLEVGTGSGYSTAVLGRLASHVISIERNPRLAAAASTTLGRLGVDADLRVGDGSVGAPADAPFQAIAVHAVAPAVPGALVSQLGEGGRMVVPVRSGGEELLTVVERDGDRTRRTVLGPCRFVPLIGAQGFDPAGPGID